MLFYYLLSAALCAVGFYQYVYFISLGYGFAIAGIGLAGIIRMGIGLLHGSPASYLLCIALVLYGARLSGYLYVREYKNRTYRQREETRGIKEKRAPLPRALAIWLSVSLLYVAQTLPVTARLDGVHTVTVFTWIGLVVSVIGLLIEALADEQKTKQKRKCPDMVATRGLYCLVRCPNYFGEILFWTGIFLSGIGAVQGTIEWVVAAIGYVCIVLIMFNGAYRLEKRQNVQYKNRKEYEAYVNRTPILIPFVPLYHLCRKS